MTDAFLLNRQYYIIFFAHMSIEKYKMFLPASPCANV